MNSGNAPKSNLSQSLSGVDFSAMSKMSFPSAPLSETPGFPLSSNQSVNFSPPVFPGGFGGGRDRHESHLIIIKNEQAPIRTNMHLEQKKFYC
jgi:hypothetical protein